MGGLTVQSGGQLPSTLEDISSFILIGREKLISVRAEIRAIDRLNLAQEVRNQKREEAQMLSGALLDAEVRLGELLKHIPRQPGGRPSEETKCTTAPSYVKPKHEIVKDLGFSADQQKRFETLADNKDLVEQVKAEARENDDIPTRSRVLDLAKQRKKREEEEAQKDLNHSQYIDFCHKVANAYNKTIHNVAVLWDDDKHLNAWKEFLPPPDRNAPFGRMVEEYIELIDRAIPKLLKIKKYLKELK